MIGLIASAVASSALALPIRPPFFRFSSVSSAPNTLVRDARSVASAAISSTSAPSAARRAQATAIVPSPRLTLRLSTHADDDLVGDRSGGELGALHRRRQRTRERHDDDAGRAVGRRPPVRGLERARRRRRRRGQRRRVGGLRPELGGRELDAIDELGRRRSGSTAARSRCRARSRPTPGDHTHCRSRCGRSRGGEPTRRSARATKTPRPHRVTTSSPLDRRDERAGVDGRLDCCDGSTARLRLARAGAGPARCPTPLLGWSLRDGALSCADAAVRRKWLNHHVASTTRAAPVNNWPRPLNAFTRAVSTIGSPITEPDGVCTSTVTSDVPFDLASMGIVTSVIASGVEESRRCRVAGTPAGWVHSRGRRCAAA